MEISTFPTHFQNPSRILFFLADCVSQKGFFSVLWKTFCLTALSSEEMLVHNKFSLNWFGLIFISSYNPQQNFYPRVTTFHEVPYEIQGKLCWLHAVGMGNERQPIPQQGVKPVWDSDSATEFVECRHWPVRWELSIAEGQNFHLAEHEFPSAANSKAAIHCCFSPFQHVWCCIGLGCAITFLLEAAGCLWKPEFSGDRSLPKNHADLITV